MLAVRRRNERRTDVWTAAYAFADLEGRWFDWRRHARRFSGWGRFSGWRLWWRLHLHGREIVDGNVFPRSVRRVVRIEVPVRIVVLVARKVAPLATGVVPKTLAALGLFARATGGSGRQFSWDRWPNARGRQASDRRVRWWR